MPKRNTKLIQLPVAAGIDAGVDAKVSEVPLAVENAVYSRRGAVSKRRGQDRSTSILTGSPTRIARNSSALVSYGGEQCTSYLPDADSEVIVDQSAVFAKITVDAVRTSSVEPQSVDVAVSGNVVAIALKSWDEPNQIFRLDLFTYDSDSLNQIDSQGLEVALLASSDSPDVFARLLVVDGAIKCYWMDYTGATFNRRDVSTAGIIGAEVTTSSIRILADTHWDACVLDNAGSPFVAVGYCDLSSTDIYISMCEDGEFTTINTATVLGSTAAATRDRVGIFPLTDALATIVWLQPNASNTDVHAESYTTAAVVSTADGTVASYTTADVGDGAGIVGCIVGTARENTGHVPAGDLGTIYIAGLDVTHGQSSWVTLEINCYDSSGYAGTLENTYYRTQPIGKPFEVGTSSYVLPVYSQAWKTSSASGSEVTQRNIYWLSPDTLNDRLVPVGKSLIGTGYAPTQTQTSGNGGYFCIPSVLRAEIAEFALGGDPTVALWNINLCSFSTDMSTSTWTYDGTTTRIATSLGYEFDGTSLVEQGFLSYPEFPYAEDSGGGSGPATGTYSYLLTYEWTDSKGQVHQSSPSAAAYSYTHSTSQAVSVECPTLVWTKKNDVRIVVWRTETAGTIYYRVGDIANDKDASEVTFTDEVTDADLTDNEQLYTTGGILAAIQPPPHLASAVWQGRHMVADSETGNIRYSRESFPGEPFIHNDNLILRVDDEGGAITAMASFSDKLVIFKARRILFTEGTGLNDIGGGANFLNPYLASTSIGTTNPKSIVRIPQGIMFEATDSTIWLLDSSFQTKPIGDRVRFYTESEGPITGAAVVNADSHVIFTTSSGSALVYNWVHDKWSQFSNFTAQDCIDVDGAWYRLDSSYYIWDEDSSNYDDNAAYIGLRMRTGWISKADVGGWFRLKRLLITGQNIAAHTLRIRVAYDGEADSSGPIWVDDDTITPSSLTDFAHEDFYDAGTATTQTSNAYTLEYSPSYSKCSSFMIEISDEEDSGDTEGWDLSSIAILVQPHPVENVKHVGTGRQITG